MYGNPLKGGGGIAGEIASVPAALVILDAVSDLAKTIQGENRDKTTVRGFVVRE